jgi:hypothetical protein
MSYSFQFRATSKADAREQAKVAFGGVVDMQPVHEQDRTAALDALDAYLDLLADDDTRDLVVSVNGSVGFDNSVPMSQVSTVPLSQVSGSVGVYLVAKVAPE